MSKPELSELLERYVLCLAGLPLSERTRREYARQVSRFGEWLASEGGRVEEALADPVARDYAVQDFKRHLKLERRWAPASVNLALAAVARAGAVPLFVSRAGSRLSARSVDEVVRKLGRVAGVELSAHVLRHTWVTRLVRAGNDVVLVADLAGHRRLETTRRYSLPSVGDRQRAVDGVVVEQ